MNRRGFTLFELTIVLTIIALIIGGIMIGQELITQARTRQQLTQIEKYNSAVGTFRGKYNVIPGDMSADDADSLGFFAETTLAGTTGHQDGNGLVEGGASALTTPIGEVPEFWRHLSDAQLIEGNFSPDPMIDPTTGLLSSSLTTAAQLSAVFPPAKLGRSNYVLVWSVSAHNYFIIFGVQQIAASAYTTPLLASITPMEAASIDTKTDDGLPLTGNVVALRGSAGNSFIPYAIGPLGGTSATACVTSAINGGTYNIASSTYNNKPICIGLRIRSAF